MPEGGCSGQKSVLPREGPARAEHDSISAPKHTRPWPRACQAPGRGRARATGSGTTGLLHGRMHERVTRLKCNAPCHCQSARVCGALHAGFKLPASDRLRGGPLRLCPSQGAFSDSCRALKLGAGWAGGGTPGGVVTVVVVPLGGRHAECSLCAVRSLRTKPKHTRAAGRCVGQLKVFARTRTTSFSDFRHEYAGLHPRPVPRNHSRGAP
jgi:hypothetical protein